MLTFRIETRRQGARMISIKPSLVASTASPESPGVAFKRAWDRTPTTSAAPGFLPRQRPHPKASDAPRVRFPLFLDTIRVAVPKQAAAARPAFASAEESIEDLPLAVRAAVLELARDHGYEAIARRMGLHFGQVMAICEEVLRRNAVIGARTAFSLQQDKTQGIARPALRNVARVLDLTGGAADVQALLDESKRPQQPWISDEIVERVRDRGDASHAELAARFGLSEREVEAVLENLAS